MPQLDLYIYYKLAFTAYIAFSLFYLLIIIMFMPYVFNNFIWESWLRYHFKIISYSSRLIIKISNINFVLLVKKIIL